MADDREWLQEVVRDLTGASVPVSSTPVHGGCINDACRLAFGGRVVFLKHNPAAEAEQMFAAEADGLAALASCQTFRVPAVLGCGRIGERAYLALEWLELDGALDEVRFADALADLHALPAGVLYGWAINNFIGASPQDNGFNADWWSFFAQARLRRQAGWLVARGFPALAEAAETLAEALPGMFGGYVPRPSLLHGDLWSGNWAAAPDGTPVLFDPAVHYGDALSDIAMTELFGGLSQRFYAAYFRRCGVVEEYPRLRALYQAYHLLNHVNLFGSGYAPQAIAAIDCVLQRRG